MKMTMRIGVLKYTNILPFYAELLKHLTSNAIKHEILFADPVTMYGMFKAGKVDVALLSSVAVPVLRKQGDKIFDAGISSVGLVKSVLFVTKFPLSEKFPRKIAVTEESNTSITLLKILLGKEASEEISFWRSLDPVYELKNNADGALLIGDAALKLFYESKRSDILSRFHLADLGDLWHRLTAFPMVWGCWCSKPGMDKDAYAIIEEILLQSSNFSSDFLNHYAYECVDRGKSIFSEEELLSYWKQFKYKFDDSEKQGLEKFLDLSGPYIDGSLIKL